MNHELQLGAVLLVGLAGFGFNLLEERHYARQVGCRLVKVTHDHLGSEKGLVSDGHEMPYYYLGVNGGKAEEARTSAKHSVAMCRTQIAAVFGSASGSHLLTFRMASTLW